MSYCKLWVGGGEEGGLNELLCVQFGWVGGWVGRTSVRSLPPTPLVTETRREVILYLTWRERWVGGLVGEIGWEEEVGG